MNELVIPPAANWYNSSVFKCAPDNTVVYGSRNFLVVIRPKDEGTPDIRVLQGVGGRINAIDTNLNWGNPHKYAVSVCEEGTVQLWDIENYERLQYHKSHTGESKKIIAVSMVGDRVVSVACNGHVIIWHMGTNHITRIPDLFQTKVKVTCMTSCPHLTWLTAFGLESGLVVIADLRKNGRVLCKLRRHASEITDLTWCPSPYNILSEDQEIKSHITFTKYETTENGSDKGKLEEVASAKITEVDSKPTENISATADTEPTQTSSGVVPETTSDNIPIKTDTDKELTSKDSDDKEQTPKDSDTDKEQLMKDTKTEETPAQVNMNSSDETNSKTSEIRESSSANDDGKTDEGYIASSDSETNESPEKEINSMKETLGSVPNGDKPEIKSEASKDVAQASSSQIHGDFEEGDLKSPELKRKVYLLASVCRKGVICIWNGGSDGILQALIFTVKKSKNMNNYNKRDMGWTSLFWIKPYLLLSSTEMADLIAWKLNEPARDIVKKSTSRAFMYDVIHTEHRRYIFSIKAPLKLYTSVNDEDDNNSLKIWTMSKDRWIYCSNLKGNIYYSFPTFGGHVNYIAVSSIDPNRLALAVADSTLRIWNLSLPHSTQIPMTIFLDKVKSKIQCIDWHPTRDNIIAIGTDEGRIGEIDTSSAAKPSIYYSNYHRSTVYRVQWGPYDSDDTEIYGLYSCANSDLILHNSKDSKQVAKKIALPDYRVANFSWNHDYSRLAVGMKEGAVRVFAKDLTPLQTLYMQTKRVQWLVWHPPSNVFDNGNTKFSDYLAVSSMERDVYIYNCAIPQTEDAKKESNIVAILKGHNSTVRSLSWCPHVGGRLVTASEDGTAQVWDVENQTIISTFMEPDNEPFVCVQWSPLDADLIIITNKQNLATIWRVTKHPPILKKVTKQKPKYAKRVQSEPKTSKTDTAPKKLQIMPTMCRLQSNAHDNLNLKVCWGLLKNIDKSDSKTSDLESDSSDSDDDKTSSSEEDVTAKENGIKKPDTSMLFGDRKDILAVLDYEEASHSKRRVNTSSTALQHISLWKGNLANSLREAMNSGVVNAMMVSLAPMVSHTLWLEICEMYAEHLLEEEQGLEASSYFLACHKLEKAVDALCKCKLFREALALAQLRLPEDNPIFTTILEMWSENMIFIGHFEVAAQCLIKLGKLSEAGELLNKRSDLKSLELAAELAKRSENTELLANVNVKIGLIKSQTVSADETKVESINIAASRFEAVMQKELTNLSISSDANDPIE